MSISEFEIFKVEKAAKDFCKKRNAHYPPDQLCIDFLLEDQSLFLLEIRPKWNEPEVKTEVAFAKLSYVKKNQLWKLYWMRQNMKWSPIDENGTNKNLEPLLEIVSEDTYGFFWG